MTKVQIPPACMFSHISYVFSSRTTSSTRKTRRLQDIALKYGPNFAIEFWCCVFFLIRGPTKHQEGRQTQCNWLRMAITDSQQDNLFGTQNPTGDPRNPTQVDKVNLTMMMMVIVVESSQVDIGAAA